MRSHKLVRYQLECYRVLTQEFVQTAVSPTLSSTSALQSAYEMGMAIAHLAKEQMQFKHIMTSLKEWFISVSHDE